MERKGIAPQYTNNRLQLQGVIAAARGGTGFLSLKMTAALGIFPDTPFAFR